MKECIGCKQVKPLQDFSLKRGKPEARCRVCRAELYKQYRADNKQKVCDRNKRHYNKVKGTLAQQNKNSIKSKKYRETHPEVFRFHTAKRRANLLQATPYWSNLTSIYAFYKACPAGYEVDHIVPLNSKIVCGLHVESNLQYLPIQENRSKSNRHII